jgi:arylsulfatase A-like enzyme
LAFEGARIIDVAPTVLYLMGAPIPDDMDGRVLVEALDEEFVETHPAQYDAVDDGGQDESDAGRTSFTQDESELIAKRLQALGYIK